MFETMIGDNQHGEGRKNKRCLKVTESAEVSTIAEVMFIE